MSKEALAIGSETKPPVLFRGDYAQWKDRFLDFIESKDNGDLILQSYQEGPATYDELPANPLPAAAAGTVQAVPRKNLPLKDKPRKTADELARVKADRLAKSYLLQGLTNEIYTHVDSYKDAKSMWDEIAKQMQGSELSASAKITKVLTEYEGFKQAAGETLVATYNRYCTLLNDIRRNELPKTKLEINIKFLRNLRPEWRSHAMNVMADGSFKDMDIHDVLQKLQLFLDDIEGAENIQSPVDPLVSDPLALMVQKRQSSSTSKVAKADFHQDAKTLSDSDDDEDEIAKAMAHLTTAMQRRFYKKPTNNQQRTSSYSKRPEYQSKPPVQTSKPEYASSSTPAKSATKSDQRTCYNCNKVGHLAKDCRAPKVRDSNYYKNKMFLAKQQEAGVALLAEDAEWLNLSEEETKDVEVNMCFLGKMQQVDTTDPDAPVSTSCSEDEEV